MARDPRWGREEENYGEDPFLAGTLAVQFIKGFQGEINENTPYYKLVACAKHLTNKMPATNPEGVTEPSPGCNPGTKRDTYN